MCVTCVVLYVLFMIYSLRYIYIHIYSPSRCSNEKRYLFGIIIGFWIYWIYDDKQHKMYYSSALEESASADSFVMMYGAIRIAIILLSNDMYSNLYLNVEIRILYFTWYYEPGVPNEVF